VIDRGPYAHHANWDLTMATGRALGMTGTAVVGAASVPAASSSSGPAASSTSGSAPSALPAAQ
jgi:rare lipoprotein A (peptidoglycan hydrolase)